MSPPLITSLSNPEIYGHPVVEVQLISTHISWLFLTGEYVYKIKKPVNLSFVDFSTLEKRHFFCQEEIRLNSRFVPHRYLGVIPITGDESSPVLNGRGPAIEYAIKMQQFDQHCLLENLAVEGALNEDHGRMIGFMIADMHKVVKSATLGDGFGSDNAIIEAALQNFLQIDPLIQDINNRDNDTLDNHVQNNDNPDQNNPDQNNPNQNSNVQHSNIQQRLKDLKEWTQSRFDFLQVQFSSRKTKGFVKECHGDLHLGNIILSDNGRSTEPFDCLEFNPQLSWIDTCSEIAFVLMDLDSRDLQSQAVTCLNTYMEQTGDYEGLILLPFYKVYRAMVRAKVALLQCHQMTDNQHLPVSKYEESLQMFHRYLSLAEQYTQQPHPKVCIMYGLSGSGKSTVARRLANGLNCAVLRSDVERKRMFGLSPTERSNGTIQGSIYTSAVTEQLFCYLLETTEMLVDAECSVIIDATFLDKKWRDKFYTLCNDHHVPFFIIHCVASLSNIEKWLDKRNADRSEPSEADFSITSEQLKNDIGLSSEEAQHSIEVRTDLEWTLADVLRQMSEQLSQ